MRDQRYVEHDRIATAAGLTSGIDLALRVVERYLGPRGRRAATARYMEHESELVDGLGQRVRRRSTSGSRHWSLRAGALPRRIVTA